MNLFTVQGELSIGTSNVYIDGHKVNDLSICHIESTEYAQLVKNDACLSNMLYVVEDDFINAYGMKIKNVDDPVDKNDAVNLEYASANYMAKDAEINVPTKISDLENDIDYVKTSEIDNLVKAVLKAALSSLLN